MSTAAIIMLVITLVIIWGGFIVSVMRLPKE
ncbi:methionine/alanine import family NSS transporter small subunit [Neisseria dentiae]